MSDWKDIYESKKTSAQDALRAVRSGHTVYLGSACGEPQTLIEALVADYKRLESVRIICSMSPRDAKYLRLDLKGHFNLLAIQLGGSMVEAVRAGYADYLPCNVSQVPQLVGAGPLVPDVALIQLSPPDAYGYCSFGVSVDYTKTAAEHAGVVIAEINDQMPRTLGDCMIHVSQLTRVVESSRPVAELPEQPPADAVSLAIGSLIADLIPDGATFQIGLGSIPSAVLAALSTKRDLGIHSGMISDAVIPLIENGVVTNAAKPVNTGKSVAMMLLGTSKLYRFAHANPDVELHPATYTHNLDIIRQIPDFIAINSALQVDLTGQVNAETIGGLQISGVGGQMDFVRGAALSPGGKAIIALPSTAAKGKVSRIVRRLDEGAAITTARADVHYVITEYGVADLRGKGLRERARCLAAIAHPAFRAALLD